MKQYTGCFVRLPDGYSTVYAEAADRLAKVIHSGTRDNDRYVPLCKGGDKPDVPEGKRLVYVYALDEDGDCVKTYLALGNGEALPADVPTALPPRIFSKLRIYAAMVKMGRPELWDALVEWLKTQTYEGLNAYIAFDTANELSDGHPMFQQWFNAAKTALEVSDETAEAILAAAAVD